MRNLSINYSIHNLYQKKLCVVLHNYECNMQFGDGTYCSNGEPNKKGVETSVQQ